MNEIVIKVSDELLSFVYRNGFVPSEKRDELNHAILQCVELPKGHGELKDVSKFVYDCDYDNGYGCDKICYCDGCAHHIIKESSINNAETLVEADRGKNDK